MRESADLKGQRLLVGARLTVTTAEPWHVEAVCKGDSGFTYRLGYTRAGWHCDCDALTRCSHLAALQRVTSPRRDPNPPPHAPRRSS